MPVTTNYVAGEQLTAADLNADFAECASVGSVNTFGADQTFDGAINQTASAGTNNETPLLNASDVFSDFIASGMQWALPSPASLTSSMNAGVSYLNGQRTIVPAVSSNTFPASSDTYVSFNNSGNANYASVTNGATAPTAPSGYVQTAKIVTSPIISPTPTLSASTAAGTLVAGTYEYQLVAYDATGYGLPSTAVSITTTATGEVILTWVNPLNETSMSIYGRVAGSIGLLASGVTGTTWTDTGANSVGAAPPTAATSNAVQGVMPILLFGAVVFNSKEKNVSDFGADPTGENYSDSAFYTALNSGGLIIVPAGTYKFQNSVTVPQTAELRGEIMIPTNGPSGVILNFPSGLSSCLNVYGRARNLAVVGEGTPVNGQVGVTYLGANTGNLENVYSYNQWDGFVYNGNAVSTLNSRLFTGAIYGSHVVVDTQPEVRFDLCRFGTNGPGDQNCDNFVKITGGSTTGGAAGPNTVFFTNTQFNQGQNTVNRVIGFENFVPGIISDVTNFAFIGCHAEAINNVIYADGSHVVGRIFISSSSFYDNNGIFDIPANYALNEVYIGNSEFGTLNINSTANLSHWHINNSAFLGSGTHTAVVGTGSTFTLTDCSFAGDLELGGPIQTSNLINTAGSIINQGLTNYASSNAIFPFTPEFVFSGGSATFSYTTQTGNFQIKDGYCYIDLVLSASVSGSGSGVFQVTNLPFTSIDTSNPNGSFYVGTFTGFSNLNNNILVGVQGSVLQTYFFNTTTDGIGNLTDAQVPSGAKITLYVSGKYRVS
jgi:hypothetical protein